MGKAEKFIQDYTRNCSNEIIRNNNDSFTNIPKKGEYCPWLTPDQARRAVEIAREEVIEETVDWLTKHAKKYYFNKDRYLGTDELVEDYKLIISMNYE